MKPIRPILIIMLSILLLTFLMGIFLEIVRGCIHIPSTIWISCLAISTLFTSAYYWLERKGKTAIFFWTKGHQVLNLLMVTLILAVAYLYSLSAAALLLMVWGLSIIVDCAYRYSHVASKTDKQT